METTQAERFRLGMFLIIMVLILIGFLIYVAGEKLVKRQISYYTIFKESVAGLSLGAKVMVNGIEAGSVTNIRIDSTNLENVVVLFEVSDKIPVKEGMRVNMTSGISLTGKKNLILTGGDIREPDVPRGGLVPAAESMMKQLTGHAETIVFKIEMVLNQLTSVLSDRNISNLSETMQNITEMSAHVNHLISGNQATLNTSLKKLSQTLTHLDLLITDIQKAELGKHLNQSLAGLDSKLAAVDVEKISKTIIRSLNSMDSTMKAFEIAAKRIDLTVYKNQDELNSAIRQMNETMENLSDFSRQIRENPSLLLRPEEKQQRIR